ncbi:hypothetical protein WJX74_004238 [Apatococcus lobatus]|uniref:AB hydrolase-1 domain-containing protein n=1 Tax=Apatococcus lobatus TaxID=904363 RepID=A0AAW1Q274_9CHLO
MLLGLHCPTFGWQVASASSHQRSDVQHICRATLQSLPATSLRLRSGVILEVCRLQGPKGNNLPPLLFLHGSYHAAWCWQDKFLPYFNEAGFDVTAISLRGQGRSEVAPGQKDGGTIRSHADDLAEVISGMDQQPILISHSLGGLVAQRYVVRMEADEKERPALRGLALLCSMPPSGNNGTAGRIMRTTPLLGARLTWGFITKSFLRSQTACKEMFFCDDMPEAELARYQQLFRTQAAKVPVVDVRSLNSNLPLPKPDSLACPVLVVGSSNDRIVDEAGVRETAAHFGSQPLMLPDLAHDLMLDTRWRSAAQRLEDWILKSVLKA